MIIKLCDICKRHIKISEITYRMLIEDNPDTCISSQPKFYIPEMCTDCKKQIEEITRNLIKPDIEEK